MAWKRLVILFFFYSFISSVIAEEFKLAKIVDFKDSPWGSTFVNDEEILITQKSGKIFLINLANKKLNEIKHNLNFLEHGQGGLLDIVYKNDTVWISYSEDRKNGKSSTSIAKGKFDRKEINLKIFQFEKN